MVKIPPFMLLCLDFFNYFIKTFNFIIYYYQLREISVSLKTCSQVEISPFSNFLHQFNLSGRTRQTGFSLINFFCFWNFILFWDVLLGRTWTQNCTERRNKLSFSQFSSKKSAQRASEKLQLHAWYYELALPAWNNLICCISNRVLMCENLPDHIRFTALSIQILMKNDASIIKLLFLLMQSLKFYARRFSSQQKNNKFLLHM